MDNEMIERLITIQMKHNSQTKVGAAIVVVELLTAMREPTAQMVKTLIDKNGHLPNKFWADIWNEGIDAIIGEE